MEIELFGYTFRYFFNAGRNPYGFDTEGLDVYKDGEWLGPIIGMGIEDVRDLDERQVEDLVDEAVAQRELDLWSED